MSHYFKMFCCSLFLSALMIACRGNETIGSPTATPADVAALPDAGDSEPDAPSAATATSRPALTPVTTPVSPAATRAGAEYILLLPREAAVPAGWPMSPPPDYQPRQPQPGDTYRFACLDLTSRSVGAASVGYRSLEGLPSIHIEYVIYPSEESAADALADMQKAVEECPTFTIGSGEGAITAAFTPLDFPAYGDAGFAAALATGSSITGQLRTDMIKIRNGHVIIGINHANYAGEPPPDAALTESLAALAVSNLDGGPAAPGE